MIKLSVVIITFNEEKNIERCLIAIKDIADEILVVDSFSTDKTEQLCNTFNVRFIKNRFDGHIQQKNFAAQKATYNHVLSLDADEVLSEELKKNILDIKNNFDADGYFFNRLNNYCGQWIKHSGWYPDQKLRLWDRRKGKWGGENPHDKYEMQQDSSTQFIKGDLLHYSYNSINEHINQYNYFTSIGSRKAFSQNKKSNIFIAIYKTIWKFIRDYFFKVGFLDGYYGFIICSLSAHATFVKYIKLKELYKNN